MERTRKDLAASLTPSQQSSCAMVLLTLLIVADWCIVLSCLLLPFSCDEESECPTSVRSSPRGDGAGSMLRCTMLSAREALAEHEDHPCRRASEALTHVLSPRRHQTDRVGCMVRFLSLFDRRRLRATTITRLNNHLPHISTVHTACCAKDRYQIGS
eukprot:6211732-Pleurochrysis_carterae.AAC.2